MQVKIRRIHPDAVLPNYVHGSSEDAGMDLRSVEDVVLQPETVTIVHTGIIIELPAGYEGQVRNRSGMALNGIVSNNSPGTIDPGYRGEVKVMLRNQNKTPYTIQKGDRVAQLIVAQYTAVEWEETNDLSATARGVGGLGSTGMR